ncbi:5428_t:CDS:2, partial [Entrophospora sp. SA101]
HTVNMNEKVAVWCSNNYLVIGNLVGVVDFDGLADVLEALDDVDVEFEFVIVLMGFDVPV